MQERLGNENTRVRTERTDVFIERTCSCCYISYRAWRNVAAIDVQFLPTDRLIDRRRAIFALYRQRLLSAPIIALLPTALRMPHRPSRCIVFVKLLFWALPDLIGNLTILNHVSSIILCWRWSMEIASTV